MTSLRSNVSTKREATWAYHGNRDAYSDMTRAEVEKNTPQVDHVCEIQLLNIAYESFLETAQMLTRQQEKELIRIVNSPSLNLNVTTERINQAKKGPFTRFQHDLQKSSNEVGAIDSYLRGRSQEWLADEGYWRRIKGSVVESYESVKGEIRDSKLLPAARAEEIIEEFENVFSKLHI